MIEDKDLDLIELERSNNDVELNVSDELPKNTSVNELSTESTSEQFVSGIDKSDFAKQMDDVKSGLLSEASKHDEKFTNEVITNVKEAAKEYTKVEVDKAKLEKQNVQYASEKLDTKQQKNKHEASENAWENKEKRRQYHYDGVAPIMEFVGIKKPLALGLLYFLVVVITPFFLVYKFLRGTIGALFLGACDEKTSTTAKGILWTILVIFTIFVLFCLIYLFLKWQGIDIFNNIRAQ